MKKVRTAAVLLFTTALLVVAKQSGFARYVKNLLSPSEQIEVIAQVEEERSKSVFEVADSICQAVGVPFELVREIGNNESGWRYIQNTNGGTDMGDLQVIDKTFDYWYDRLELTGGKTRRNYLAVGIHYLRYNYERYGSWKKARFAYGRGNWRDETTWTCLEEKFMSKIDWNKYDHPSYVKK